MTKLGKVLNKAIINSDSESIRSLLDRKRAQIDRITDKLNKKEEFKRLLEQTPDADYYGLIEKDEYPYISDNFPVFTNKKEFISFYLEHIKDIRLYEPCAIIAQETGLLVALIKASDGQLYAYTYTEADEDIIYECYERIANIAVSKNLKELNKLLKKYYNISYNTSLNDEENIMRIEEKVMSHPEHDHSLFAINNELFESNLSNMYIFSAKLKDFTLDIPKGELIKIDWDACSIGDKFELRNGDILEITDMGEDSVDDHEESYIHFDINGKPQGEYSEGRFNRLGLKGYILN